MIEGSGLPRGVPDTFLEAYLAWESKLSNLSCGQEVKEQGKLLIFDELMRLIGPKTQPNIYSELYWFAAYELSQRELTAEQRNLVREAWQRIKYICLQNPDRQFQIVWTLSERRNLLRLLGHDYLK